MYTVRTRLTFQHLTGLFLTLKLFQAALIYRYNSNNTGLECPGSAFKKKKKIKKASSRLPWKIKDIHYTAGAQCTTAPLNAIKYRGHLQLLRSRCTCNKKPPGRSRCHIYSSTVWQCFCCCCCWVLNAPIYSGSTFLFYQPIPS